MTKATNRSKRSAVSPAPDRSSLRSAGLNGSAKVSETDIARRAYELYLARDCEDGHDVADWLRAERELQTERGASEGVIDEMAGTTQAAQGRTKRKVGEAIEHVGNVIKK